MKICFDERGMALAASILAVAMLAGCQATTAAGPGTTGPRESSPIAKRRFEDAVRAYEEGVELGVVDWDFLAGKFESALEEDDHLAEAWFDLGVIEERRGNPERAMNAYRRAIAAKPTLFVAYENLGLLLEAAGDEVGAGEQYKAILRVSPEHAGARARLAGLFLTGGDRERALEHSRDALLRDPKNIAALKVMLRVHEARGDWEVARLVALRAQRIDERDPEIPFLLGQVLRKKGDAAGAAALFRKSLEVDAGYVPALAEVASDALHRHDYEQAAKLYGQLVRAEPHSAAAHLNLGTALHGLGQIDEALAAFEKAQALDEHDARPAFSIAYVYHRGKDQPEEAIPWYRRFLSGSAINLPGSHPVFALLREAEQLVHLREEARLAEEAAKAEAEAAAKREVEEAAAAAERAKAAEAASRDDADPDEERAPPAAVPAPAKAAPPVAPAPGGTFDPDEPIDDF
ncbi:MAG TPA: adventurous gliding motility TPR repeat lipoprotein GltE [Vulgatibacter sp.]|nr:adventurous gliding motility TPR repeat lipoprotein GltE [Vulgatibacter sp.]